MKPVIHVDDVPLEAHTHGDRFATRDGSVGEHIGARLLGCSVTAVPPGKRAYPFHCHHVNEELFVILDGTGVLRHGANEHPVRAGSVIATPPGGPETAHQLINTGDVDLRYLAISTMIAGDVVEYPDSGKVAVYVGSAPGGDRSKRTFTYRGRLTAPADYWDGE
ncbi:MAG: cupin domain-containing protein [Deltaproteobacteria bacterium]|nr:cupin domain-containing protein [Deltaproteobacteria bacterium]